MTTIVTLDDDKFEALMERIEGMDPRLRSLLGLRIEPDWREKHAAAKTAKKEMPDA